MQVYESFAISSSQSNQNSWATRRRPQPLPHSRRLYLDYRLVRIILKPAFPTMKLLFSSSRRGLVDIMGKRLAEAGFSCEIRYRVVPGEVHSDYKELWVQMDNNTQ